METLTPRIVFSPFNKLPLSFSFNSVEETIWETLEFSSYKNISSNVRNTWQIVALVSESGKVDDFVKTADVKVTKKNETKITFQQTPLFELFPSVSNFVHSNGWVTERIRGSRLLPRSKILRHSDPVTKEDELVPVRRIHCVLSTNSSCFMFALDLRGKVHKVHMKEGEVWEIYNYLPHWVVNEGLTRRDHLIFDVKKSSKNNL
jgi:hypothetical protein